MFAPFVLFVLFVLICPIPIQRILYVKPRPHLQQTLQTNTANKQNKQRKRCKRIKFYPSLMDKVFSVCRVCTVCSVCSCLFVGKCCRCGRGLMVFSVNKQNKRLRAFTLKSSIVWIIFGAFVSILCVLFGGTHCSKYLCALCLFVVLAPICCK